jgi:sec-independent protein translocase protein TatB
VLENLGGWEILGLILVALFVIGPERLPKVLSDGMGMVRKFREMARNATGDLSKELGTTIELEDLHPKTFLRKHLLSEAEEDALRKPFQDIFRDVQDTAKEFEDSASSINFKKVPVEDGAKPAIASHNFDDAT